jgi:tetratricopeptide (TPR) repeat protein
MRHLWAGLYVIAAALLAPATGLAQPDDDQPVIEGQITEAAARGERLFEVGRFGEASVALQLIMIGETGDDTPTRQLAQYQLAVALYHMRLYQASVALFSEIAGQPSHPKWREALPWLSKIALDLPEPADVIERVGKYESSMIARFNTPAQRDLYWKINYLLGRYKYRNHQYKEAIELLQKVGAKSEHAVEAQILTGMSYVQLREPQPALETFERVVRSIDDGAERDPAKARMRDLAFLSMARIYYSTSVRLGAGGARTISLKRRIRVGK